MRIKEARCSGDPELRKMRLRFGEEVRAARIKAGLTQAQLAQRLGRLQKYVSLIETGSRRLPIEATMIIMRALGLEIEIGTRPIRHAPRD
jgi:transcriptional regulator with XRE-family HTH domain